MPSASKKYESLWLLTVSPFLWMAHFLLSYVTAAIWCEKVAETGGSLWEVRMAIAVYTAVALAGIGITGWIGFRKHGRGIATAPHDADTPEDHHRFLGFATLLLSALSAVATSYSALVILFFETCD